MGQIGTIQLNPPPDNDELLIYRLRADPIRLDVFPGGDMPLSSRGLFCFEGE